MSDITNLSATEIAAAVRGGTLSAAAVTDAFLARIAAVDPQVGAFLAVTADAARSAAAEVDAKVAAGTDPGKLAGVPIAIKDNLCTRGVATTCASKILDGFIPPYDATVITRLQDAGAVIIGKTNLDEFAMGSSCENSALGTTRNPWDLTKVPGGSSGGSAAAVAARLVPISLGSDTGGSIRQPAAFCGTLGLKPTYGRVSRFGLVAFASSLDQVGPFANTVDDIALVMEVLSGHDPKDSTSLPIDAPELMDASIGDIKGLRVGIPGEYFADGISEPVRAAVMQVVDKLVELGAVVSHVSMPHTEYTLPAYYIVAPAEASSNLARYDGVRYGNRAAKTLSHSDLAEKTREQGFGPEVKRRILIGTYALSAGYYDAFYHKAMQVRTLIQRDFLKAFEQVDVLITPTTPTTAFGIGEKSDDPLAMKLSDICTLSANLAGVPGISIPAGFDDAGLPFGVQFLGPALSEAMLLKVSRAYLDATHWNEQAPAL
jgi:aspartyl-tRNA(Asn)/glutamyl-tRNA(Gln) amidotransferase subunit A